MQYTTKVQQKIAVSQRGVQLLQCITDYKGVVSSQADGKGPAGGLGGWYLYEMKLPFCCMREAYSGMHLEID